MSRILQQQCGSPTPRLALAGVTAGSPGSFDPLGVVAPADFAALVADPVIGDSGTNKPTTAWSTGQFVLLVDDSSASWTGTAWQAGPAD
jgi:hypothetical protein